MTTSSSVNFSSPAKKIEFTSIFCRKKEECTSIEIIVYLAITAVCEILILCVLGCFMDSVEPYLEIDIEEKHGTGIDGFGTISEDIVRRNNDCSLQERNLKEIYRRNKKSKKCKCRKCGLRCCASVCFRLLTMLIYIFDFCSDFHLAFTFLVNGEVKLCFINAAPGIISSVLTGILLTWMFLKEKDRPSLSWASIIAMMFVTIIPKAYISGWLIIVGEQSWKKRWYLQALSYLYLIEICIEGFPQFLIEYRELVADGMPNSQALLGNERWTMWVSLFPVIFSVTDLTLTFDKVEDIEECYNKVQQKNGNISKCEGDFWDIPTLYSLEKFEEDCCCTFVQHIIHHSYQLACFLERVCDIFPRWFLYTVFLNFNLYSFFLFIGVFLVINVVIFLCFYFSKTFRISNDEIKRKYVFGIGLGTVANTILFFDWRFFRSEKKKRQNLILFLEYYILIMVMSGIVHQSFIPIIPLFFLMGVHFVLKLLRFILRGCLKKIYEKEIKECLI